MITDRETLDEYVAWRDALYEDSEVDGSVDAFMAAKRAEDYDRAIADARLYVDDAIILLTSKEFVADPYRTALKLFEKVERILTGEKL